MEWYWHPVTWSPTYGFYSEEAALTATGLGMMGGLALGQVLAPHVEISGSDIGLMTLGGAWGATVAGQAEGFPGTGYLVGAGLGTLLGYGLATPLELGGDVVVGGHVGLACGTAAGLGAGWVVGDRLGLGPWNSWNLIHGSIAIAGTAGMGLGAYLAWRNPAGISADDVMLGGVAVGWASWQTIGWWNQAGRPASTRGLNVLIPAAVGSIAALTAPRTDISWTDTTGAASLGLWGAYLGAVGAGLADADDALPPALVLSDIGLGVGILLNSPRVDA